MKKSILVFVFLLLFITLIKISIAALPVPPPTPQSPGDDGISANSPSQITATCNDNIKNQNETGIDCGGYCKACTNGILCLIESDCESNYCNPDGKCSVALCNDGWKNGNETGIDCGGNCKACISTKQDNNQNLIQNNDDDRGELGQTQDSIKLAVSNSNTLPNIQTEKEKTFSQSEFDEISRFNKLGIEKLNLGLYNEAILYLDEGLLISPKSYLLNNKGMALEKLKEYLKNDLEIIDKLYQRATETNIIKITKW